VEERKSKSPDPRQTQGKKSKKCPKLIHQNSSNTMMILFSGGTGSQKSQVIIHSTASPGTALKRHGEGSGSKGSMVRSAHADHNSNEDKVWQRRLLRAMAMDMDRGPRLIHRLHLTIKHQNFSRKLKK